MAAPNAGCTTSTVAGVPTLSPNCTNVEIGRRNIEGGGRTSDYEHQNYRAVMGTKGDFLDAWSYDAYGQFYYTTFFNSNDKYQSFTAIDNALQVVGTKANPVCVSGPPCVPYNMWSDGGVTQQQIQYLYLNGTGQGTSTLRTLHGEVTGKLGKYGITSPLAQDGVGVNIGFEHRNDHEFFQPDSAEQSGVLSGFGSAAVPIDNSITVGEEFAELRAPLVQDKPFAKELLFDTGFRHSDYKYAGSPSTITNTYKFEVQYAPIADIRFRASYDKAIRAPSVARTVHPAARRPDSVGRRPLRPADHILAQAVREHGRDGQAQYNSGSIPQGTAGQLSQLTGGNTQLKPEQAETYTFGVNFAPSADTASHRQHRLLPHSADEYGRCAAGRRHSVQLRQHRQPALLQPNRARSDRQPERQQHRIGRLLRADQCQSRRRLGQRHRSAAELQPRAAAGLRFDWHGKWMARTCSTPRRRRTWGRTPTTARGSSV